jgi:hypothetical protein
MFLPTLVILLFLLAIGFLVAVVRSNLSGGA